MVEFIVDVRTNPPPAETSTEILVGSRYRVVNLVEAGWDLERIAGSGPDHVRILDSQMATYVRLVSE